MAWWGGQRRSSCLAAGQPAKVKTGSLASVCSPRKLTWNLCPSVHLSSRTQASPTGAPAQTCTNWSSRWLD